MTDGVWFALTLVALLGCGLVAGVFFAFSTFVMRALGRLPAPQGIAAMQSVNVTVLSPWFLTVFTGTALLSLALVVLSLVWWAESGGAWPLAGGLLYFLGTFVLTRVVHIPRNTALMDVDPDSEDGARYWARFLREWTAWNHVRMLAALAASASFAVALVSV